MNFRSSHLFNITPVNAVLFIVLSFFVQPDDIVVHGHSAYLQIGTVNFCNVIYYCITNRLISISADILKKI